jgi:hypothetical protein
MVYDLFSNKQEFFMSILIYFIFLFDKKDKDSQILSFIIFNPLF